MLEVGGKGSGKNGKMTEFDTMMAAEEMGVKGAGGNWGDAGF